MEGNDATPRLRSKRRKNSLIQCKPTVYPFGRGQSNGGKGSQRCGFSRINSKNCIAAGNIAAEETNPGSKSECSKTRVDRDRGPTFPTSISNLNPADLRLTPIPAFETKIWIISFCETFLVSFELLVSQVLFRSYLSRNGNRWKSDWEVGTFFSSRTISFEFRGICISKFKSRTCSFAFENLSKLNCKISQFVLHCYSSCC